MLLSDSFDERDVKERERLFAAGKAAMDAGKSDEAADCFSRLLYLESNGVLYQLGIRLLLAAEDMQERQNDDSSAIRRQRKKGYNVNF